MNVRPIAAALALGTLASGCVENSASIEPIGICAPSSDAKACSSSGTCDKFLTGQTFVYVSLAGSSGTTLNGDLYYFMQFENQLPDNGSASTGRTNTNDAWISGVDLSFAVHASALTPAFALPDTSRPLVPMLVRATSSATPAVILVPSDYIALMSGLIGPGDEVLVEVTLRATGTYAGGADFTTGPMTVPVWVINSVFAGYVCDDPTKVVTAVCITPGSGGATFSCDTGSTTTSGFTISGSITGLTGSGLVLSCPGLSSLSVASGAGSFQFGSGLADGASYNVTVLTQPAGQTCTVSNGTGTVSGSNVSNVVVTCV